MPCHYYGNGSLSANIHYYNRVDNYYYNAAKRKRRAINIKPHGYHIHISGPVERWKEVKRKRALGPTWNWEKCYQFHTVNRPPPPCGGKVGTEKHPRVPASQTLPLPTPQISALQLHIIITISKKHTRSLKQIGSQQNPITTTHMQRTCNEFSGDELSAGHRGPKRPGEKWLEVPHRVARSAPSLVQVPV